MNDYPETLRNYALQMEHDIEVGLDILPEVPQNLYSAADEIESLKRLLERSYKEFGEIPAHLGDGTYFHDGDDFHELMNDIIEKIGYTTPED